MDLELEELTDDKDFLFAVKNIGYERTDRTFHQRTLQFEKWNDEEFLKRFRLSKNNVKFVTDQIRATIIPVAPKKNHALSAEEKVLLTLRFLTSRSFLKIVGDVNNVHESTTSRVVYQICCKIA
ncbi:hypothetical protein ABEB36_014832 [Hypothenemus hampei]|uniref:Nuclease HARBI1 n=1 Tax=Hypothenemus hampei TaxID=57062 RepID=A0ABD1E1A9_HYPHA